MTLDEIIIEKERHDLISRSLENQKKRLELKEAKIDFDRRSQKFDLDMIDDLRKVLTCTLVDSTAGAFSSETKFKNAVSEEEQKIIMKKIMKLIARI